MTYSPDVSPQTRPRSSDKAGERLAWQIQQEIIFLRWPVNRVLGSQEGLMSRYGVGRAALREAIRLLEQRGIARMRSGPGGGLMVMAPAEDAVNRLLATHLLFARISPMELQEAWSILDELIMTLTSGRLDGIHLSNLQRLGREIEHAGDDLLDADDRLLLLLADVTGNAALHLLIKVLCSTLRRMFEENSCSDKKGLAADRKALKLGRRALIDALEQGDKGRGASILACCRVNRFAMLGRHQVWKVADTAGAPRDALAALVRNLVRDAIQKTPSSKLAESTALALSRGIDQIGFPAGAALGSTLALAEQFGLSEAVFRESVRILEQHGVVRMLNGRGGGLVVGSPNADKEVQSAAQYIECIGISLWDYGNVREGLDKGAACLAARRITAGERKYLLDLAARQAPPDFDAVWDELNEFQQRLGEFSRNRVLSLFQQITTGLVTRLSQKGPQASADWVQPRFMSQIGMSCQQWLWISHGGIYQAMAAGHEEDVASQLHACYETARKVWLSPAD